MAHIIAIKYIIAPELKGRPIEFTKNSSNLDIQKQIKFYEEEIKIFEKKLSNEKFRKNAPKKIIEKDLEKLAKAKENLKLLVLKNDEENLF